MRGRALVRFMIVVTLVTGMLLAPVMTWPSAGLPPADPSFTPRTAPLPYLDEHALR